jgi:glycosyltransferase involved in cell wall biosynthesis
MLQNPAWLKQYQLPYEKLAEVPESVFTGINQLLDQKLSDAPEVTIMIAAWNEEVNVLRCIATLSNMKTSIPYEILVVNNNSADRTQDTLNKLHVRSVFQPIQGPGPARQMGQENARGKYILLADADCFYPDCWVNEMMQQLTQPGVVCVYGRYSFISEPGFPRWQLAIMERMKDVIAGYRHLNRPYLNTYGISMGYLKEAGLKVGYVMKNVRGEDGRLTYGMMQYGKVKQVKANKARAWTGPRTLQKEGSLVKVITSRIVKEAKGFFFNLHRKAPKEIEKL